jgi:hypothetical protein
MGIAIDEAVGRIEQCDGDAQMVERIQNVAGRRGLMTSARKLRQPQGFIPTFCRGACRIGLAETLRPWRGWTESRHHC